MDNTTYYQRNREIMLNRDDENVKQRKTKRATKK